MDFAGQFETHVTVTADAPDALAHWASNRGLRFVHILLDAGRTRSQPMLTWPGRGTLADQQAAARALVHELAAAGFAVERVKIEAAPDNDDIPESDADADPGRYFEHHVKLLLPAAADTDALAALAARHAARLSRNARRARADGRAERLVTQRCHRAGRATAAAALASLVSALTAAGFEVLEVEAEYVLTDTAPGLDAGWLEADA